MHAIKTLRDYTAKAQLYRDVASLSPPPYLRRNLKRVLDQHEKRLQRHASAPELNSQSGAWKMPTDQMIEDFLDQDAVLHIASLFLRPHSASRGAVPPPTPRPTRDGPDWLPNPSNKATACQVIIKIHGKVPSYTSRYVDLRDAQMVNISNAGERPVFEVQLKTPFSVAVEKLFVARDFERDNGAKGWKRMLADRYTLEICIQAKDSRAGVEFLSQLEGGDRASYHNVPENEAVVRAFWGDRNPNDGSGNVGLPELPPDGYLLKLRRSKGPNAVEIPYGLAVQMGWSRRKGSVLVPYNRTTKLLQAARQLPTPDPSDDSDAPQRHKRHTAVRYRFRGENFLIRDVFVEKLSCVFCNHTYEHSSVDRLRLHYMTHHDHFVIEVEDDEMELDVKVFKLRLVDEFRDMTPQHPSNFSWQAPSEPFDCAAHVNDEYGSQWRHGIREPRKVDGGHLKQGSKAGKLARTKTGTLKSTTTTLPAVEMARKKTRVAPDQVPDLPTTTRKLNKVPNVPEVKFYRSISKQVVEQGTLVVDSDEDMDDSWLAQSYRRDLARLGLDGAALTFHQEFNRHLEKELPTSAMLASEMIVRFARQHKHRLTEPGWRAAFQARLEHLYLRGTIRKMDRDYCLALLGPEVSQDATESDAEIDGVGVDDEDAPQPSKRPRVDAMLETSRLIAQHVSRTPKKLGAMPPPVNMTPNTKLRHHYKHELGSKQGDASTTESGPENDAATRNHALPLGRRKFICARATKSHMKPYEGHLFELAADTDIPPPAEAVTPRDLDYRKFRRIVDVHLICNKNTEDVFYASGPNPAPVVTEANWSALLEEYAERQPRDDVVFEVRPRQTGSEPAAEGADVPRPSSIVRGGKAACACGKVVEGRRGVVSCGNPKCRRDFHQSCVGVETRSLDWRCSDCSS
jgi:hypothetical protein